MQNHCERVCIAGVKLFGWSIILGCGISEWGFGVVYVSDESGADLTLWLGPIHLLFANREVEVDE